MAIDPAEVRRIAELARLELPAEGVEHVAAQLSSVLEFVAKLNQLELGDCEPTSLAPAASAPRGDVPNGRRLDPGVATSGAPEGDEDFFLVPPIVENLEP